MKIIKKIYKWCTATRLRKILSTILATLIFMSAIRFLFLKPKEVYADSTLGFNEGYGSTINDLSGNITGTISGATWKTEEYCKFGKCLYYDGNQDYVSFGDDADLDFVAATNFTIEGWFRTPDITSGTRILVSKYNSTAAGYKVYIDSSGYVTFGIDDDTTFTPDDSASTSATSTAYDDNKWHHFAAVKTGTTSIALYVDGILHQTDSSIAATGTLVNSDTFYVGIDSDGTSNDYSGFIDDVKIYSTTARSTAEIKADFTGETRSRGTSASFGPDNSYLSNGLVGYWKMDESSWATNCSTASAVDSSGNGNDGKPCPNASAPTVSAGKFGNAGVFDGTNDYLDLPASSVLTTRSEFTISGWIKPTPSTTHVDTIVGFGSGAEEILFGVDTSTQLVLYFGGWTSSIQHSSSYVNSGTWQHVTVTRSGSNATFYFNGSVDNIIDNWTPENTSINSSTRNIGGDSGSNEDYPGSIDELRIYNRALSPAEVKNLYNWAPGPVGYWPLNENSDNTCTGGTNDACDRSGNGLDGANTNTESSDWSPAKFGSGLNLDGTDEYIQVTDNSLLTLSAAGYYTWEFWINPNSMSSEAWQSVWAQTVSTNGGSEDENLIIYALTTADAQWGPVTNGITVGWISNSGTDENTYRHTVDNSLTAGSWSHVAITYNASLTLANRFTIFVNGIDKTNYTDTTQNTQGTNVQNLDPASTRIGSNSGYGEYFPGKMDDAKLYNYVRSSSQIVEDMNGGHPAPGSPVGSATSYWKLDEGYSTTAYDSSINANNLTLSTASWTNDGKFGKAFNGLTNVRMSRTDDDDFDFAATDDFSLSLWFNSDSTTNPSANEYLLEKGGNITTDAIGYAIYTSSASDGLICFGIDDDATNFPEDSVCSTSDLYDNTWHHLVVTKTGTSRLDMYIDGKPNGTPDTSISSTGTLANAATFYIGDTNGTDGTDEFLGNIDEVKVYRLALTTDQVKAEYNRGGETLGALSTNSSNIASWADTDSYCPPGQGSVCTAPYAEYKLDENTGTTANDTSGNGNSGTLINTARFAPGKLGSGVYFDGDVTGNDTHIQLPNNAFNSLSVGSISLWFKPNDTGDNNQQLFNLFDDETDDDWWELYYDRVNARVYVWTDFDSCAGSFIGYIPISGTETSWHHLVYTNNTSGNKFYLDGIQVSATYTAGTSSTNCFLDDHTAAGTEYYSLGCANNTSTTCDNTEMYEGLIDNVRVYNYVRTQSQISWEYNRGKPVAWYKMDESSWDGTASEVKDSSGNAIHGVRNGNATTTTAGKMNNSGTFDGTGDYVSITDPGTGSAIDITGELTMSAWIYTSGLATNSWQDILTKGQTDAAFTNYWMQIIDVSGTEYLDFFFDPTTSDGTYYEARSTASIPLNQWVHVAIIYNDSANSVLYCINGICSSSSSVVGGGDPASASITANNSALRIGWSGYTGQDFSGKIDEVSLYNYALNTNQIKVLYNTGATLKFGPLTGSP